jgi:hypothetical protein
MLPFTWEFEAVVHDYHECKFHTDFGPYKINQKVYNLFLNLIGGTLDEYDVMGTKVNSLPIKLVPDV